MLKSVELFSGAGGLAMGLGLAGFETCALVERDRWACDTMRENASRGFPLSTNWPVFENDVREFDFGALEDRIDLVAGGPPCQPFSMGGKHQGNLDDRDMFPTAVDAVRQLRPKAFIFENVRGLTRQKFANYYQYILLQLSLPEVKIRPTEDWSQHHARLEKIATSGRRTGLVYEVVFRVLNAANFGVPQKRDRVFIVGFRRDLGIEWSFPDETHSRDLLIRDQWVTGDYWERHRIATADRPLPDERTARRAETLRHSNYLPFSGISPWLTVRDALLGIPDPRKSNRKSTLHNHRYQPGARSYKGHTGSPLDLPAKALKAGDHGVPGGENMILEANGNVRYFTVREAARIQTFPDGYIFHGSWSETMRQLGNAVPLKLAHVVARTVAEKLLLSEQKELTKLIRRLGTTSVQ